ncbi:pilus assembly PilX family protein [Massilia consociata]|uniref:Agglutinin biogenesis protein MshP n=1 Tax=Massilia consociata TaxID=760117 RepID=A0ABV6FEE5_9BURK
MKRIARPAPLASRARQAGVGLVTAIFLLVVLAGLGVASVTLFTSQQASSSLDVEGAKAYQAARAGIEWGLYEQLRQGRCAATNSFGFPDTSVLGSFRVTVSCRPIDSLKDADGDPLMRWRIAAVACNQPVNGACDGKATNRPDYVQRRLEVEI